MTSTTQPTIYVIGGPNGAGKTTAAFSLMPETIGVREYVNADAIASALSPFQPQEVSFNAGRIMLNRIKALAKERKDFAFESTLASRSFAPFLAKCKLDGYEINLIYIWLRAADLAVARVAERVRSGGHFVPEETIRSRYFRSLKNFFHLYMPLADRWKLFDNSAIGHIQLVAEMQKNRLIEIIDRSVWDIVKNEVGYES